eukprot:2045152-Rhodomonas_salina.1
MRAVSRATRALTVRCGCAQRPGRDGREGKGVDKVTTPYPGGGARGAREERERSALLGGGARARFESSPSRDLDRAASGGYDLHTHTHSPPCGQAFRVLAPGSVSGLGMRCRRALGR